MSKPSIFSRDATCAEVGKAVYAAFAGDPCADGHPEQDALIG